MHEWACCDEAANHQLPIAADFWIIRIVSTEECSSLMHNLMQILCSTRAVILNATVTQYTCSLNSIYHPHWLVQWNHCSHMHVPVHSPWLPGYTDVVPNRFHYVNMVWTDLVIYNGKRKCPALSPAICFFHIHMTAIIFAGWMWSHEWMRTDLFNQSLLGGHLNCSQLCVDIHSAVSSLTSSGIWQELNSKTI